MTTFIICIIAVIFIIAGAGLREAKREYKKGWIKGYKTGYTEGLDNGNSNVYARLGNVDVTPLEDVAYMVYEREQQ
jgi:hypothetical protein